ncbi:MAG TPA: sugar phosphate isomerase/epimerase family protein [Anaerolineae bacterium]|nr:sugar phosphate isomerase/epimerase family protein [Anaerolineae bacterium]
MIRRSASLSVQYDSPFSPFPATQFLDGLAWAQAAGFHGVELIVCRPTLLAPIAIGEDLARYGLAASTLSTGQAVGMDGLSMTSPDPDIRLGARRRLFEQIDFSAQLDRPNVTIGLLRGKGGPLARDQELALLRSELSAVAEYAARRGVVINLEPINRYECALLNSSESAYDLICEIGSPESVGVLYDTFHSNIEDADMLATIAKIGHKISHVHFADSNRRLPCEGHTDFPGIVRALQAAGFAGYASLEVSNIPNAEHIRDFARLRLDAILDS